jgi:glycerol uptake facilitator-like aquaporin
MKAYFAELPGTFILVFAGTGAIVINDGSGGADQLRDRFQE